MTRRRTLTTASALAVDAVLAAACSSVGNGGPVTIKVVLPPDTGPISAAGPAGWGA